MSACGEHERYTKVYSLPAESLSLMNSFGNGNSVFVCGMSRCLGGKGRQFGIYLSGMLFALAWWVFVDGVTFLCTLPERTVYIGIEDWAPGIITTLGMIIICLIDKEALRGSYGEGASPAARFFLFLGFAMLAGGFAGSVSVLVVKYGMEDLSLAQMYIGYGTVAQCTLIMIRYRIFSFFILIWLVGSLRYFNRSKTLGHSTAILWISQSTEESTIYV